jgi:S1-C subfamily serine protease
VFRFCVAAVLAAFGLTVAASAGGPAGTASRVKSGTAFFVSTDGFLVTSAHVVADCRDLSIWDAGGRERRAYLIATDPRRDIALLWVDGRRLGPFAVGTPGTYSRGEDVVTLGFATIPDKPLQPLVSEGAVLGEDTAERGNRVLMIGARLRAGNSGGAVLTRGGLLVGMIIGRDENHPDHGVAIPIGPVEALLANYGITLQRSDPPGHPRVLLNAISALIQCSP